MDSTAAGALGAALCAWYEYKNSPRQVNGSDGMSGGFLVIQHGHTGWLGPKRDAQAIAQKIGFLVEQPSSLEVMARNAREEAMDGFDARLR